MSLRESCLRELREVRTAYYLLGERLLDLEERIASLEIGEADLPALEPALTPRSWNFFGEFWTISLLVDRVVNGLILQTISTWSSVTTLGCLLRGLFAFLTILLILQDWWLVLGATLVFPSLLDFTHFGKQGYQLRQRDWNFPLAIL